MKTNFSSTIGPVIHRYVTLKRSLGRRYNKEIGILSSLDRFLSTTSNSPNDLTAETFLQWCKSSEKLSSGGLRNRMRVVRNLCLYRRRCEPNCFVPDRSIFPRSHQPIRPYIFSVSEIRRLLEQSGHLTRHFHSPLRPELFRLIIVLLFTAGLRHRELLRLNVGDYDPNRGTLLIRESKFRKSRLLPLPKDVCREVDRYLDARRRRHLPVALETPIVWNRYKGGRAYESAALSQNIRLLLNMAKIRKPDGRLPRIHDFRHSFAVNALLRWYRSGVDVQSKLPFLSAYMGHVEITHTYHYLHFVEPLASLASARFTKRYGALVNPPGKRKGGPR